MCSGKGFFNCKCGMWAVIAFLVIGCTGLSKDSTAPLSPRAEEARALLEQLTRRNKYLKTFKGIGELRLKENKKAQRLTVAWMGQLPEKLRMEALAVSGQPAASLAGDGRWLYFLSHADGRYYKRPYEKGFGRFLSIPLDPGEMVTLLSGRVPVVTHHVVDLKTDPDSRGFVLILKKRWQGIVEKFYLGPDKQDVFKIERFDADGTLVWRLRWGAFHRVSDFSMPFWLRASRADGAFFELMVRRCWTNVPLDPRSFALSPTAD